MTIEQAEPRFPQRVNGSTSYPIGRFQTVLAGPELEQALDGNYVREVGDVNEYAMGSPLASFAEATYRMRCAAEEQGSPASAMLAKALGVSLLGKLSQRVRLWEEVEAEYDDPLWGEWWSADGRGGITRWRSIAGIVSREIHAGLAPHAVPSIPVWVWSAGRVWLWERMQEARLENVLYADTDGLIVTPDGYARLQEAGLILPSVWGQLRHVAGPCEVEVMGPKCVRIGDKIVKAGAPKEQRSIEGAPAGYWYRQPFAGSEEGWLSGQWVEEYRSSRAM